MKISVIRGDIVIAIAPEGHPAALMDGRCATVSHQYGMTRIVQCDWWDHFLRVVEAGYQFDDDQIQDILDEIADAGVDPDVENVAVHRPDPSREELEAQLDNQP